MSEITTAFDQRPVVVRHRQFAMIRPSADILALNIVDSPFKLVSIFLFDLILYFMSGLQPSASQFFIFVLFTYVTNLAMLALFRALASINRAEANATTFAGVSFPPLSLRSMYCVTDSAISSDPGPCCGDLYWLRDSSSLDAPLVYVVIVCSTGLVLFRSIVIE